MTIEVEQTGELILDPKILARQFISEAVANLRLAQQQAHAAWLADQAAMERLERSAATRRGWANRKARLAGTTAPVDELEDVD